MPGIVKRSRKLTLKQIIDELEKTKKSSTPNIPLEYQTLINYPIYFDSSYEGIPYMILSRLEPEDVIHLLPDVIINADQAECIAASWNMLELIEKKDIRTDTITASQVKDLFFELSDDEEISQEVAELVASVFNERQRKLGTLELEPYYL